MTLHRHCQAVAHFHLGFRERVEQRSQVGNEETTQISVSVLGSFMTDELVQFRCASRGQRAHAISWTFKGDSLCFFPIHISEYKPFYKHQ